MRHRSTAALLLALLTGACAYFNAMYNAERRFADAERAAARGDVVNARRAWIEAIDGAASSYRRHPDSRWADDALLLIARARLNLGEYHAARAAAGAARSAATEPGAVAAAHVLIGAASVRLGDVATALTALDSALAGGRSLPEARLWRARVRFATGDDPGAWDDLGAASAAGGALAAEADLEAATRAFERADPARFAAATTRLMASRDAALASDSVLVLLEAAAAGPGWSDAAVSGIDRSPWPAARREPVELARIGFLAGTGDTVAAITSALGLAGRATAANAATARVLAARLELRRAASVEDLGRARATLLPALANDQARSLLRSLRVVEVLLDRAGRDGQPLALFAAAEMVRDTLHAPAVAQELFLAYAELAPDAVWAPKALLAAAALTPAGEGRPAIADRFAGQPDNVYVRAVLYDDEPVAFEDAEARLGRSLTALRFDAFREADQRDIRVGTAVARLDSLKARVRADSLRLACGTMMDSLAIAGIRADSVRGACLRGDTAQIAIFMRMDTLLLRDTTAQDTMRARNRRRVAGDTFPPFGAR